MRDHVKMTVYNQITELPKAGFKLSHYVKNDVFKLRTEVMFYFLAGVIEHI